MTRQRQRADQAAQSFTAAPSGILGTSALRIRCEGERLTLIVAMGGTPWESEITRDALRMWTDRVQELASFVGSGMGDPGVEIRSPYLLARDGRPVVAIRCTLLAEAPQFFLSCAGSSPTTPLQSPLELAELNALLTSARSLAAQR